MAIIAPDANLFNGRQYNPATGFGYIPVAPIATVPEEKMACVICGVVFAVQWLTLDDTRRV